MKRLIRANTYYNDIPTLEIEIDIYNLQMIRASAVYGADEEIDKLSDVIDKNGNIINADAYQKYLEFIEDIDRYISTLNVQNISKHKSNKSASIYYSFENIILDNQNKPVFRLICKIRVSDHMHPSKKYRKEMNTVEMNIIEDKNGISRMHLNQFITRDFVSYDSCFRAIKRAIKNYQEDVLEEMNKSEWY